MKKVVFFLLMVTTALTIQAKNKMAVELFAGYAFSAFEKQSSAASTYLLGAQFEKQVAPQIDLGVEFNIVPSGFGFTYSETGFEQTTHYKQMMFGVHGKYALNKSENKIYGKAGLGLFTGNAGYETTYLSQKSTGDLTIKSAVGFSIGAGLTYWQDYFAEFNYNIVSRTADSKGAKSMGMNSWTIRFGYHLPI